MSQTKVRDRLDPAVVGVPLATIPGYTDPEPFDRRAVHIEAAARNKAG